MSKTIERFIVLLLLLAAVMLGSAARSWKSITGSLSDLSNPIPATAPVIPSSSATMEEYPTALADIHTRYTNSMHVLGATLAMRLAKVSDYQAVLVSTRQALERLLVPKAELDRHLNRLIQLRAYENAVSTSNESKIMSTEQAFEATF